MHPLIDNPDKKSIILKIVQTVISTLQGEDANRTGGYFRAYYNPNRHYIGGAGSFLPTDQLFVGQVPNEKADKYKAFSEEKAIRTADSQGDFSSYQSRDPANERWGGAILTSDRRWLLSFSGLPEKADETAMLFVAVTFGLMSFAEASELAWLNKNEIFFSAVPSFFYFP